MLRTHRSERADALVAPLAAVLAVPPQDPFTPDVVAVPTRGVERWLAQRLSHHLGAGPDGETGVCANIDFASPSRLVGSVLAGVLAGVLDVDPDDDPWHPDRLLWPLLRVIDHSAGEPWCEVLTRHLGLDVAVDPDPADAADPADPADAVDAADSAGPDDPTGPRRGRRLAVARHLAGLFASYHRQRPGLVLEWLDGGDGDGAGGTVPADLRWQPELWRRVRREVGVPSPAERIEDAVALLRDQPDRVDLPARLSVFGPTRLPAEHLAVLAALAEHRDVHLWLPHPSPRLWEKVAAASAPGPRRRALPPLAAHPLLASMARDTAELQVRLGALAVPHTDEHHPAPAPPATLLGALQQRLRDDDATFPPVPFDPQDRSVEVHACHGRARQVEVLREALVGLLADDPTLEPRDVLVMCPDVEAYAPLVTATFGLAGDDDGPDVVHPGQTLRVRLADRSPRRTNPVLGVLEDLLRLADGRVTASEVLDLAAREPVRRRFALGDDDLDRVRSWVVATGTRWGEDTRRRARYGLGVLRQGTWDAGLDRLLLGVAMAEEDHRYVGSALPLDDVDSTDVDLAGRLAELVDRLGTVLAALDGTRPLAHWLDDLDQALDLLTDVPPDQSWQAVQARRVLADVRRAGQAHDGVPLRLPDVRALLAGRLEGRPTRAGFRTGALTVCSLEPMRAVPHRVVCLLGMDDGAFPRGTGTDGDDVLLRDPCLGERDQRSEDRQLFLDAVAAAGERLVVLYAGADERTGAVRAPAVPVGELLDALDVTAAAGDGRPVRDHVVVRHPLQPVDDRAFTPGALRRPGPFSFDVHAHRAALAARAGRTPTPPFLPGPLPAEPSPAEVDLDDLVALLEHPAKWFLRHRLGISLAGDEADVEDRLPLTVDPLQKWAVGNRLLQAALAGVPRDRAAAAEWRRGEVPPRALGRAVLNTVLDELAPVLALTRRHTGDDPGDGEVLDVAVDLPDGTRLTGSVTGVHERTVVRAVYSRLGAKHRLRAWVQLLALSAARPDGGWRAVTVGRGPTGRPTATAALLPPLDQATATRRLDELVRLRPRAARQPLPLPVDTAASYARARLGGDTEPVALEAAARTWHDGFERADEHHRLCWGDDVPLSALAGVPDPTEQAWWPQETTRFGVLARRVWHPLLAHEETETS
ncbi:exodeoxyribonuclease V subunit gamma [Kineosporiaceae bacterium SCSIO 59966]|nr:exodeoxyribonuclease V subunit gamma [Kineosporiaceae bacterium SCSIO 59966]